MLFSKAFTCDMDLAENRHSFRELKFVRDRAVKDFPALLMEAGTKGDLIGHEKSVDIEIMHLPIPVSMVQVDDRLFANLWLHGPADCFEEIVATHPWRSLLTTYINAYFDPQCGRKYASDPGEEVLELFDHERIPRGIYPRSSFYDTDYSQLVTWAFVFDRKGRLLIHRRSDNAKDNRGMWDKSVGGHINLQTDIDSSRAVVREVLEELYSDELKKGPSGIAAWWVASDREIVYLGEWRPDHRQRYPFQEINSFDHKWAFFRLRDSQYLSSPRLLPEGPTRRLRVIADVFLFVAGSQLNESSLSDLKNSEFKLIELAELKNVMDKALRGEKVSGFDRSKSIPEFTPDLTNIMTGRLRDTLEEFAQYIKRYVRK
jgi:hypothetical protein